LKTSLDKTQKEVIICNDLVQAFQAYGPHTNGRWPSLAALLHTTKKRQTIKVMDRRQAVNEDLTSINVRMWQVDHVWQTEISIYHDVFIVNCRLTERHIHRTIQYK